MNRPPENRADPPLAVDASVTEQLLDEWPIKALQATLGTAATPMTSGELPLLWHWLYFLPTVPREQLGVDGHERVIHGDNDHAPPRRMFAAVRSHMEMPLRIGERAHMAVSVINTRDTVGSSGALRIVTYEHRYSQRGQLCIVEQRDIVYLSGARTASTAAAATAPQAATWRRTITPDAALLMRFSALTFNSHRIHYDQHYAQQVEGHPERVVHAPLTSLLLLELARSQVAARLRRFEGRARSPLYIDAPIELCATPTEHADAQATEVKLLALNPSGAVAMQATAWC